MPFIALTVVLIKIIKIKTQHLRRQLKCVSLNLKAIINNNNNKPMH
jgi:hypothetical protein